MKKILYILSASLLLGACLRNLEYSSPLCGQGNLTTVSASLVKADVPGETKSVCSLAVETFVEAYVFAFRVAEDEVCTYTDEGGLHPMALHLTDTDSFRWTLPQGEDLEIWAVANPADDALKALLEAYVASADLTKQDLLTLPPFQCSSSADLKELDGGGKHLPMSAVVRVRFDAARGTLSIPLKRLFAKYDLKLNCAGFIRNGWSISTASVRCVNGNGTVPYFYDGPGAGYRARANDLVPCLDHDDGRDLDLLSFFGRIGATAKAVAFYFPENCQGNIVTEGGQAASTWKTVYQELGQRVSTCSYLSITIVASKADGTRRSFSYRVYPGSEPAMNRNFDIVRNTYRMLTVTLIPGMETDSFRWTPTQTLTVEPGGTVEIPFETTLENTCFGTLGSGLEWVETAGCVARFRALPDALEGTVYALGGDEGFEVSDRVPVTVSDTYRLKGIIPPGRVYFEPFRLSISPYREDWPAGVSPSSLSVVSTAPSGTEAIEILSGPRLDGEGWCFTARCTGPRSANDFSETLQILDSANNILGQVEIPDIREVFSPPAIFYDGSFVLPVNGADCARINLQFETPDGAPVSIPAAHYSLVSADSAVDDLYVEYDSDGMDVYLPYWEGIPGLQEFDQSRVSADDCLQLVSNAFQLRSKTGYVFHSDAITFQIPNPFVGFDAVIPHARVVSGHKVDLPDGWTLQTGSGKVMEWHIEKGRSRPALTLSPVLLSAQGFCDSGSTYVSSPDDAFSYDTLRIPCDGRTYGQIGFCLRVENVRSGESASAWAAVVDVVRELEISADFRIHQRHYSMLSPYDEEAIIRVSPVFDQSSALNPFVGMDFLKIAATSSSPVHPTRAEAESLGPYWVNYYASAGVHHFFGSGTRYLLPESGLSYEIQWNPGPTAGFFNYRVITLWNPPKYAFDIPGFREKHPDAFPEMRLVPAAGDMCQYLEMDPYTRIVFYWERWKSAEWTDGGKGWYLCDNEDTVPRYSSAYYMPLSQLDPLYGRCFFGNPTQTGTDVDPVYGGDPFFIQSSSNTFETILDY